MSVRVRGGGGGALFGNRMHRTLRSIALSPARSLARSSTCANANLAEFAHSPRAQRRRYTAREGGREGRVPGPFVI